MSTTPTRAVSLYEVHRIRQLNMGALWALMVYLMLRWRGLRWPWLLVICVGMMLAARVLTMALIVAAGVAKPWR